MYGNYLDKRKRKRAFVVIHVEQIACDDVQVLVRSEQENFQPE